MTLLHATEWLQKYRNSVAATVDSGFDPECVTDEQVNEFILEYNRPEVPDEPPAWKPIGDRRAENFVWIGTKRGWYCVGDPICYTWQRAFGLGADSTKILVDRQTLIDEVLAAPIGEDDIATDFVVGFAAVLRMPVPLVVKAIHALRMLAITGRYPMSYDQDAEDWRARAEIAEAELAEHHKGFKETCAAMVRNAKERDEWKGRAEITESQNDTLLRACDYYKAQVDRTREHWKSKALEMEDSRNEWQNRAQTAEAARDQALQAFNDTTRDLMSVADPLERLRRIAEAHHKDVDSHGGTWGTCIECDHAWPCPTYVWATDQTRDGLATWDPDDDGDEEATS